MLLCLRINVYIGLTYNIKNRYRRHLTDKRSSVYKHIQKTNLTPKYIVLTKLLGIDEIQKAERFII